MPAWLICLLRGHDWRFGWGSDMRADPIDDDGSMMAPDDNATICRRCAKRQFKRMGPR